MSNITRESTSKNPRPKVIDRSEILFEEYAHMMCDLSDSYSHRPSQPSDNRTLHEYGLKR